MREYPKLRDKWHSHHIWQKYLRGPENGDQARINAAYHQMITNAFNEYYRGRWPNGPRPEGEWLARIMYDIYTRFPLQ
jgi:hypothetical protein